MSDTYYQKLLDDEMRQKVPNWKSVKQYINLNIKPSPVDRETGMAMIHVAAYSGEPGVLQWCIDKDKSSINLVNSFGRTPLHMAADANMAECAKVLIDNGADLNPSTIGGLTPLHIACRNNSYDVLDVLLQRPGLDVDAETIDRATPAMLTEDARVKESLSKY